MPKTKIICTIGPASENVTKLRKMMLAGMDVIRLNFSHGTHREHLKRIKTIRRLNKTYRCHIRIMGDLEGYRIRIGRFKNNRPMEVRGRQVVWLTQGERIDGQGIISFDFHGDVRSIRRGQHIFIDDGTICLVVVGHGRRRIKARVVVGGIIKSRKGINAPGMKLDIKGLSHKDKEDLLFCAHHKLDFVAQSFVRNSSDIAHIKNVLKKQSFSPKIIAKIENREGINNIDSIIKTSDGIMVARGDMGISIPIYEVPFVQKAIIKKCNKARKPVITATQMLESMAQHKIPSRAEVSDITNAILDGSDYCMLSGETAAGRYPVESVDMMNRIIVFTEKQGKK